MPTPSSAAPATASPGTAGELVAQPGDPLAVADQVLRQRRRPSGCTVPGDQLGPRPAGQRSAPRRRSGRSSAASSTCSSCVLAEPADAGPDHGDVRAPSRRRPLRAPSPTWPRSRSAP